ncbi:MAG: hypothetical protein ACI83I_002857 [Bacteroidia bacterium]|jgi:hypothetical protein
MPFGQWLKMLDLHVNKSYFRALEKFKLRPKGLGLNLKEVKTTI